MINHKDKNQKLTDFLRLFFGIFMCLSSLCLMINMTPLVRVFSFAPTLLFGASSYVIYAFFDVLGIMIMFKSKTKKNKKIEKIIGVVLLVIGTSFIASYFSNNQYDVGKRTFSNFFDGFSKVYNFKENNFLTTKFISLFSNNTFNENYFAFGGGLLGQLGLLIFTKTSVLLWIVSILLILVGIFLIFFFNLTTSSIKKLILKKSKKDKPSKKTNSAEIFEICHSDDKELGNSLIDTSDETQIMKQASFVEKPLLNQQSNAHSFNYNITVNGFKKAHYTRKTVASLDETIEQNVPKFDNAINLEEEETIAEEENIDIPFNEEETKTIANQEIINEPVFDYDKKTPSVQTVIEETPKPLSITSEKELISEKPIKKEKLKWIPPSSDLLKYVEIQNAIMLNSATANERMANINNIFANFRIGASCSTYVIGPSVTRYNIEYEPSVSANAVSKIEDDLSIRLGGLNVRFVPIVEGLCCSGLEIPNKVITTVSFKEVFEQLPDVKSHPLAFGFGKNVQGEVVCIDFDESPHLLVAGTTGSGKTVFIHSIITTLIMRNSPDDLKLVLVDPKRVEMVQYADIPHLLCPILYDAPKVKVLMEKLVVEMNERYEQLKLAKVENIKSYNKMADEKGIERMPYIVVIFDEYADMIESCKEINTSVHSIAAKARASGIHLLVATQRPATNIVQGNIKGNLPTHVALMTSNYVDSQTIIGEKGAESLLGKGDMLVQSPLVSSKGNVRLQSCFIQRDEINHVCEYLRNKYPLNYDPRFLDLEEKSEIQTNNAIANGEIGANVDSQEEAKYQIVKEWVMSNKYMSMSRIQGEQSVGFNRARRFFNRLIQEGIVSKEPEGNRGCPVLIHDESELVNDSTSEIQYDD